MEKKKPIMIFCLILPLFTPPGHADTYGNLPDVEVVRVYDGDTFFVDIPSLHPIIGVDMGIRLRGANTPEIRGRCDAERALAIVARDFVRMLIEDAERVDLIEIERGKFFRIVATVLIDGVDLAELLIEAALAVPDDGSGQRGDWCE